MTVITTLTLGGAETATLRLLSATKNDFDHVLVSLRSGDELAEHFRASGIPVIEAGFRSARPPLRGFPSFLRLMRRLKPDLISAQMYHAALFAAVARLTSVRTTPLIWNLHYSVGKVRAESLSTQVGIRGCLLFRNVPNRIVFVSRRSAEQHFGIGLLPSKSVVIPNGYDLTRFQPRPIDRDRLRSDWGFQPDDVVIGLIARLHSMKDQPTFLKAVASAIARNPKIAAILVGPGTDTIELPNEIRGRVLVLGSQSDMPAIMSACDIGCLSSSRGEAFPNVLAEFLSCERPCIATDVGDCRELIGRYGTIVPPSNPTALADAIVRISAMPVIERAILGAEARQHIASQYDIAFIARRHADLWCSTIGDSRLGMPQ